jgi:hypothetical protein
VCWVPAVGGGNFCRDSRLLGLHFTGQNKGGEPCTSGGQCRSGSCSVEQHICIDPCCSDTNCAGADALCRLGDGVQGSAFTCEQVTEKKQLYETCAKDAECSSGLCIDIGDAKRCSQPCCSSTACGLVEIAGGPRMVSCDNVERDGTLVRACAGIVPDSGIKVVGEPCTKNEECRSARCVIHGEASLCSDVCCTDASCGDPTSFVCRPSHLVSGPGPSWALRCQPK